MITEKEIDAIRFYQGDVRKRLENGKLSESEQNEGFWGISSAYRTMNCLMFSGIANEKERIREKNSKLKPQIFLEAEKVVEVFCDIYRAMCKYAASKKTSFRQFVYRTERGISIEELKKGHTVSFTSTSKENNPEKFLREKSGLTLLDIIVPSEIPHLDFEKLLGENYLFKNQREILLPPFLEIKLEPLELTETEQQYRDIDHKPPCGKYLVSVKNMHWDDVKTDIVPELVFAPERCRQAATVLEKLINGEEPDETEITAYDLWKKNVQDLIKKEFYDIHCQYFGKTGTGDGKRPQETEGNEQEKRCVQGKEALLQDIREMRQEFNEKRRVYKRKITGYHYALIITNAIPPACMALSFVQSVETFMKIAAVITSTAVILLSQLLQTEVYDIKLKQRSKTYMELCDLVREIKYETKWSEEIEQAYVLKYRNIMKEDEIMSLNNIETQSLNEQKLYQSEITISNQSAPI